SCECTRIGRASGSAAARRTAGGSRRRPWSGARQATPGTSVAAIPCSVLVRAPDLDAPARAGADAVLLREAALVDGERDVAEAVEIEQRLADLDVPEARPVRHDALVDVLAVVPYAHPRALTRCEAELLEGGTIDV